MCLILFQKQRSQTARKLCGNLVFPHSSDLNILIRTSYMSNMWSYYYSKIRSCKIVYELCGNLDFPRSSAAFRTYFMLAIPYV